MVRMAIVFMAELSSVAAAARSRLATAVSMLVSESRWERWAEICWRGGRVS